MCQPQCRGLLGPCMFDNPKLKECLHGYRDDHGRDDDGDDARL